MVLPPWDFDIYGEKFEEKFEARDHFMLMPEQKRQIQARRALKEKKKKEKKERAWFLQGLTYELHRIPSLLPQLPQQTFSKMGNGALERLNSDCLIEIMRQSSLEPGLWNLLSVSEKCRAIWKNAERSVLRGMQEERFSDYIEMFGKIGHQSNKQLQNLASALAADAWRLRAEVREHEISFMDLRKDDERLYEKYLILYLEGTNNYFNDRVQMLHESGKFKSCSQHITKSAVLVLWRMGWSRGDDGDWEPAGSLDSSVMVDMVREILSHQPEPVRLRIRDILHLLVYKIDKRWSISKDNKPWVEDREKFIRQGRIPPYNAAQWHKEAVNATIVREIVLRGIGGAIDYIKEIDSGMDVANEKDRVQCPKLLERIRYNREYYDEYGTDIGGGLGNLKIHVEVAQELGVDIFANL